MHELATGSGTAILKDGERLVVVDRGGPGLSIALFVAALLTFIVTANGFIQLGMALGDTGGGFTVAAILCALGAVAGVVLYGLMRFRKRRKQIPLNQLRVICVLDFAQGQLLDAGGRSLGPLSKVTMRRKFQVTSSTPALVLVCAGRSVLLAKGSPFGGGIGALEHTLEQYNIVRR